MPRGGILTIKCANHHLDNRDIAADQERDNPNGFSDSEATLEADIKSNEYVVSSVKDTGHGMAKEVLAQALEPFFTTREIGTGTGLGLSMVQSLATASGGYMEISNEPGKGPA